ncbi:tetrahydromethanopterin S-methyltransferase subunit A [Nitrososphaera sp.]|uniref:tetrahydromethanopterin S-methyltransferase subunit A n=1 Tax=Nitrososphaera sp. TaxID=1971748 RepID=UPI0031737A56
MTGLKRKLDDAAGKVCEALIPIKHELFRGRGKEVAICTLGSIDLLEEISRSELMKKVALAGRLLSENKGIDAIVAYVADNPGLRRIVLCGKEVKGHYAGQALIALHKNGVDRDNRIIGAKGPYPTLESPKEQIASFRKQVEIDDLVGVTDLERISALVA